MIKTEELLKSDSCLNRAYATEPLFVLMGRDPIAPSVIRYWAVRRIQAGINTSDDPQIQEALQLAQQMLDTFEDIRKRVRKDREIAANQCELELTESRKDV